MSSSHRGGYRDKRHVDDVRPLAAALRAGGHSVALAGNTEFGPPLSAVPECDWVVCEVSSFQLEGSPTFRPRVAVFTNLTPEHLDRHGSMERYGAAKARMFAGPGGTAGLSVVNVDDRFGRELAGRVSRVGGRLITYGVAPGADVRIEQARWDLRHATLRVRIGGTTARVPARLPGSHNAHNIAAAIAAAHGLGLPSEDVLGALATVSAPPGRWQVIDERQPFTVVVDYAHTPDGIAQVLGAIRAATRSPRTGRVWAVFGAVGLADHVKARDSARVLSELSDELVLTTGSAPRSARIVRLAELRRGARGGARVRVVLDRRTAIESAVLAAERDDVVVILGLGALRRLVVDAAGTVVPHRDEEAARSALRLRGKVTVPCA